MFDTNVTIVGTALNTPEWRRTPSGALVANFKVASHSRRFDKDNGRWVDGDSLRVRVTCWRRLAEGVAASVLVGDPVVVTGRMYTRDWIAEDGQARVSYELEAAAVGHDLARGQGKFTRNRATTSTSAVEDAESDGRIAGEPAEPVGSDPEDRWPSGDPFEVPQPDPSEAAAILREVGLSLDSDLIAAQPSGDEPDEDDAAADESGDGEEETTPTGRGRRTRARVAAGV
jgi:single-strand DNA-binding protein